MTFGPFRRPNNDCVQGLTMYIDLVLKHCRLGLRNTRDENDTRKGKRT